MYRVLFALFLICVCGGRVFADETVQVFVDSSDCTLKERGYMRSSIKNPIVIPGKRINPSLCEVYVDQKKYEDLFRFCFLSGVDISGSGLGSCKVAFYDHQGGYMFETKAEKGLQCTFTCIKK